MVFVPKPNDLMDCLGWPTQIAQHKINVKFQQIESLQRRTLPKPVLLIWLLKQHEALERLMKEINIDRDVLNNIMEVKHHHAPSFLLLNVKT